MVVKRIQSGYFLLILANVIWGLSPIYFKFISAIPADIIVAYRVIWSFFFILCWIAITRNWRLVKKSIRGNPRVHWLLLSATTIAVNWLLFIGAINHGEMLATSMGYFIAPLLSVLIGLIFFKEHCDFIKLCAIGLAIIALIVQVIKLGSLPFIAISLAVTLNIYTILRKKIAIESQSGMLIETACLLPCAIIYICFFTQSSFFIHQWGLFLALSMVGVITTLPLLFFTTATNRLPLSILGFFQYIAPSLNFLLAVFIYKEPIDYYDVISFVIIWLGLVIVVLPLMRK